jgi:glycosyltransferase involved in cell wall biosynthesis
MYLAGTQDPETALRYLRLGENDPTALYVPYIRQFLHLCEDYAANCVVISTRPPRRRVRDARFTLYYLPNPLRLAHGRRYELGQVLYGLLVTILCMAHRPQVVFVGDGILHYATVPLLRLSGTKVILSFHNTLWTCSSDKPDRWRGIARRWRLVFSSSVSAIMCASATIADNFAEVTDGRCRPIVEFLPTFIPGQLDGVPPPPDDETLTVLYVGRIMQEKGIFDMLRIAEILRDRAAGNVKVIMCGEGRAEQSLIEAIDMRRLSTTAFFVGQLDASEMLAQYASANIVVVPTTTAYREGFNHVVAEGALAVRMVVTSRVCPAALYFEEHVRLAAADSPESYATQIWGEYGKERSRPAPITEEQRRGFYEATSGWRGAAECAIALAGGSGSGALRANRRSRSASMLADLCGRRAARRRCGIISPCVISSSSPPGPAS